MELKYPGECPFEVMDAIMIGGPNGGKEHYVTRITREKRAEKVISIVRLRPHDVIDEKFNEHRVDSGCLVE